MLGAGQYVTFIVDSLGGTGSFDVDIVPLADPCPGAGLGMGTAGDIGDFTNSMSSSCGPAGFTEGSTFSSYPDATYGWTSPGMVGSNSGCDITVSSGFPVALSLQQGTCDGPEVECAQGMFDMGIGLYQATVSVGHIPPTDFTIAISPTSEPFLWLGGSGFAIAVNCWAVA